MDNSIRSKETPKYLLTKNSLNDKDFEFLVNFSRKLDELTLLQRTTLFKYVIIGP